ncbi:unnamed protein product [marine sediment metagenome]|uniref:Uncharacterized protein n=1 Tax=marine sediment metagenome TaxID=412755 RepID=X1AM74_9ZZZZ
MNGYIYEYDEVTKKKVAKQVDFYGVMNLVPHDGFDKPVKIYCNTPQSKYEDFWRGFELSLKGKFLSVDEVTKKKVAKQVDFYGVMNLVPHDGFDKPVKIYCNTPQSKYEDFWRGFELSLKGKFLSVDEEQFSKAEPTAEDEPWNQIPDHLWDKIAVQMWWEGYTNREIADRVGVTPRRVTNRISELRGRYSELVVPKDTTRRKLLIR